jgi:hypothetical protein
MYMQSLIGSIAASFGIPPQMANAAVSGVTSLVLQKSKPKAASGLLSSLPNDVTSQFSESDKQKFTSGQATNLTRYDILKELSRTTGIKDIDKLDDLSDNLLENIKKNTNINASDALDKQELFQALNDFKRQQPAA